MNDWKKLIVTFLMTMVFGHVLPLYAQQSKATWIWYPGDFEVNLSNKMQNRRTDRGTFFPPFWRMDSHYVLVEFHKEFNLSAPEDIEIFTEGQYNVKVNGKMISGYPKKLHLEAGKQKINIKVYAQDKVPAVFVQGKTIHTDGTWLATFEDKEWIDETGKASDASGTTYVKAGFWNFDTPQNKPSAFKLATKQQQAVNIITFGKGKLVDFGKETFGFVQLHGLKGKGSVNIYYGESKEEATSPNTCETFDKFDIAFAAAKDTVMALSKAFRYVYIETEGTTIDLQTVSMLYEYLPVDDKGSFSSSDEELNKIWQVGKYTMELTTREFFIDGIKRDRWIWSGDAYQSYLMNYYLAYDLSAVRRTILALRGKDPVTSHINTIMDYTFYWFLSIYDYYQYSGDKEFIALVYPKMKSLMAFCLQRRNQEGLMKGLAGDWVFIDWAEGLSKQGEVSFEQLLLCRSLETMALCGKLMEDAEADKYTAEAKELKQKIFDYYWNDRKRAFAHSRINGQQTDNVTRYTNMFAIFFDYLNADQKQDVKQSVLLNNNIQKITTPYMRFYELEALCAMGEQDYVMKEMKDYWGGMLKLGATSFWEEYNPAKKDAEHYAMYGRAFGKSLCHAWGASPIYLLGKYYLGVRPTSAGYQTYEVVPVLGGLQWMKGTIPTPHGEVALYCSTSEIKIKAAEGQGTLRLKSKRKPEAKGLTVKEVSKNNYEIVIPAGKEYHVKYQSL